MKWLVFVLSVLLSYVACMELAKAEACDQQVYDKAYKSIVVSTLDTKIQTPKQERDILLERNELIRALRKLCKGQLSTYEKGNR